MKLNKILALALSGVMAVSMLAGCSGNSGNGGQEGEEQVPGTTNAATVLNDTWDKDAKVVVNFTYSNSVETALKKIVEVNEYTKSSDWDSDAQKDLARVLDVTDVEWSDFNGYAVGGNVTKAPADTKEDVKVSVYRVTGVTATKAMENAAKAFVDAVGDNFDDELTKGKIKYTFTYDGEAAMVSVEDDGVMVHYIAYVMTSNTAESLAD